MWQNCDTVTQKHCHCDKSGQVCDKNCDDGLNPIYKKSISFKKEKKKKEWKLLLLFWK